MSAPSHGWLGRDFNLPRTSILGVEFDSTLPTRWEEFDFVREALSSEPPGFAYDAGSGLTPNQHVMPYILSKMGWFTVARDKAPESLEMPFDEMVAREVGDMCASGRRDRCFDAVVCVSVLEHCDDGVRKAFVREAARILKPNGVLAITVDQIDPSVLASWFEAEFDVGARKLFAGAPLTPTVSYLVARRKA